MIHTLGLMVGGCWACPLRENSLGLPSTDAPVTMFLLMLPCKGVQLQPLNMMLDRRTYAHNE
jgi:hypothetical protein